MALLLGPLGRRIINYVNDSPRLNRGVDRLTDALGRLGRDRFSPGLTRAVHRLYTRVVPGSRITFDREGIWHDGEKIAANPLDNYFYVIKEPQAERLSFRTTVALPPVTPERFTALLRRARFLTEDFAAVARADQLQKQKYFSLMLIAASRSQTIEELADWDAQVRRCLSRAVAGRTALVETDHLITALRRSPTPASLPALLAFQPESPARLADQAYWQTGRAAANRIIFAASELITKN